MVVQLLRCIWLFVTLWTMARQAPGKNTGVGCHLLLQGIFPTQRQACISCIAGGFFTRALRETQVVITQILYVESWLDTALYLNTLA